MPAELSTGRSRVMSTTDTATEIPDIEATESIMEYSNSISDASTVTDSGVDDSQTTEDSRLASGYLASNVYRIIFTYSSYRYVSPGAPNSAKFRGVAEGQPRFDKGRVAIIFYFLRVKNITF